jgi:tetratricopeptide (TPR) repeat protein
MLRLFARLLIAVCLLFPLSVIAGDAEDKAALDQLFVRLARAPDHATAQKLDRQIWSIWTSPSDPDLASRMLDVFEARDMRGMAIAIELLDELVVDYPDYAEGWNQRATLYFLTGNLEASLADCEKVLALEPRHFGALSGQAIIHLQMGRRDLALKSMAAALAVHPFLNEAGLFPELNRPMTRI